MRYRSRIGTDRDLSSSQPAAKPQVTALARSSGAVQGLIRRARSASERPVRVCSRQDRTSELILFLTWANLVHTWIAMDAVEGVAEIVG
jgi:hypothetical protein